MRILAMFPPRRRTWLDAPRGFVAAVVSQRLVAKAWGPSCARRKLWYHVTLATSFRF